MGVFSELIEKQKKEVNKVTDMKKNHPLFELGLYEKAMPEMFSWREKLEFAKKVGYDFVEMSIDETDEKLARLEWNLLERLSLVEMMYEVGMPIRSMCLSGHRKYPLGSNHPEIYKRGMEIMRKAIKLADDLGIRIIQLAGYDVYYEKSSIKTQNQFLENLKKSVEMAAQKGILLGFETMETSFMDTVAKAMKYVYAVNSPYLAVYPDSGNLKNASLLYSLDVYQDMISGQGHIAAMHLKETLPGKYREIVFGAGHVNFKKMIDVAWGTGVRRYVTELWYTGNPKWKEEVYGACNMMRKILEEKGC